MSDMTEFGPRKTVVILAIVAGCFALLWPKIFYPMMNATPINTPPTTDGSVCCDVIFESDITAVDIVQEMCQNILRHHQVNPRVRDAIRTNKLSPQVVSLCREEVLARCGIDLSSFLASKEQLGKSYKQVLDEIRTLNGSLCLRTNFGVPLSGLGTPHLIRYHILMPHSPIHQERSTPPHAGGFHPALRERGRAIPASHVVPRIIERPDHASMPMKMRPPMGGAGHVVAAPKGTGSMGIIMPLYTIGIVLFFLYTISKVLSVFVMPLMHVYSIGIVINYFYKFLKVLRKNSDNEIISRGDYLGDVAEREFQKMIFSPEVFTAAMTRQNNSQEPKKEPVERAPTIDELKDHDAPKSNGLAAGVGPIAKDGEQIEDTSPTVQVVNMEMTASCEGGKKCSRPTTPILMVPHSHEDEREKSPPVPIYLEGALPPQCELLVTDSKTQVNEETNSESPVVLSGKMTLSVISLDQVAPESSNYNGKENENIKMQNGNNIDSSTAEDSDEGNDVGNSIDESDYENEGKEEAEYDNDSDDESSANEEREDTCQNRKLVNSHNRKEEIESHSDGDESDDESEEGEDEDEKEDDESGEEVTNEIRTMKYHRNHNGTNQVSNIKQEETEESEEESEGIDSEDENSDNNDSDDQI